MVAPVTVADLTVRVIYFSSSGFMDGKLPQVQIARAIAALSVVYFHSHIALRKFPAESLSPLPFLADWGYLGVSFFFVISGYIIALVCDRPSFAPASFAVKRFFRIYPLYWMFLFGTLALELVYGHRFFSREATDSLAVLKNIAILPLAESPIWAVGWSLEHEILFYAIAAIVVPYAGIRGLFVVVAAFGITGLILPRQGWDYHLFAAPQLDFACGMLVYLLRDRLRGIGVLFPAAASITAYALVANGQPGLLAAPMLLIALLNVPAALAHRAGFLIAVGDASYSLYLGHWFVMHLMSKVSPVPSWAGELFRLLAILISIQLAFLLYRHIERPLMTRRYVLIT